MIKLIKANSIEELESFTMNWIIDQENDKREVVIRSSQVIILQQVERNLIDGAHPIMKSTFCNWLVYGFRFSVSL